MRLEGEAKREFGVEGRSGENSNLEYIFDALLELRNLAKGANETSLVYYIEMAALEAGDRFEFHKKNATSNK